jgi:hypothetical protein
MWVLSGALGQSADVSGMCLQPVDEPGSEPANATLQK